MATVEDDVLNAWFCREVLPLERTLVRFIKRNIGADSEAGDLRQEIYERVLKGAQRGLPEHCAAYLFAVARNHLINHAKRGRIISIELVADLELLPQDVDVFDSERHLTARDELRRALQGLERLPPRCREVVRLRKVEGYTTREVAEKMGIGIDTVEKQMTNGMRALTDFMLGGDGRVVRPKLVRALTRRRP